MAGLKAAITSYYYNITPKIPSLATPGYIYVFNSKTYTINIPKTHSKQWSPRSLRKGLLGGERWKVVGLDSVAYGDADEKGRPAWSLAVAAMVVH
jgi:hypothetical protein